MKKIILTVLILSSIMLAGQIDFNKGVLSEDKKMRWYDGSLFLLEGRGFEDTPTIYSRMPKRAEGVIRDRVWQLSKNSSGINLTFSTKAKAVTVRWTLTSDALDMPHMPATGVSGIDVYGFNKNHGRYINNLRPTAQTNEVAVALNGSEEYKLYLPLYNGVSKLEIGVEANTSIATPDKKKKKQVVFYGTSIMQGACASRPAMAASTITARNLNIEAINLGFSGNALMEPEIADFISELNPDLFMLDCLWNMSESTIKDTVVAFVKKLRKAHPYTPILMSEQTHISNTQTAFSKENEKAFKELKDAGVQRLYYLSSQDLIGNDGDGTVDACHHNDLGMYRQATIWTKEIKAIIDN